MNLSPLAEEILAYCHELKSVSFVNLTEHFPNAKGNQTLLHSPDSNIALWVSLSPELTDAIISLRNYDLLTLTTTSPLTYLIDGTSLNLPIAVKWKNKKYKKLHWLPVTIDASPKGQVFLRQKKESQCD